MSIIPSKVIASYLAGQNEALPNNIFSVMIGGDPIGSFLKVTGLESVSYTHLTLPTILLV